MVASCGQAGWGWIVEVNPWSETRSEGGNRRSLQNCCTARLKSSTLDSPGRRIGQRRDATRAPARRPEWPGGGQSPSPLKPFWRQRDKSRGFGGSAPNARQRGATSFRRTSVLLELRRRDIAKRGVEPFVIVDAFEKLADPAASLPEIPILGAIDLLVLEGLHEGFASGVVIRIALAAHADLRLVLLQQFSVGLRRILHAAIGVVHQTGLRPPLHQSHAQRGRGQFGLQRAP